jgi:myo-inositol-1(or 4)-monophosphatase
MQQDINVPFILNSIKTVGDSFLEGFKKAAIPHDKESLAVLFNDIEDRCTNFLKDSLSVLYPEIPWAGAEFDMQEQEQPLALPEYWLCDAMDGAVQYLQHLPGWTINLVLVRNRRPHFAVIYDPLLNEMFWAKEGTGAYMNDTPLKPAIKTDLSLMLAVFEHPPFQSSFPGLNKRIGAAVEVLLEHLGAVRNYGPHGLQIAYVAAGRIDVFYQEGLDTYNWLGGILIAKEAGAQISTVDGADWNWGDKSLFVAAPGIREAFLEKKRL